MTASYFRAVRGSCTALGSLTLVECLPLLPTLALSLGECLITLVPHRSESVLSRKSSQTP